MAYQLLFGIWEGGPMEFIQNILKISLVVFIYIVIIGIIMRVAEYIGERLGFGRFFLNLWGRIKKRIS